MYQLVFYVPKTHLEQVKNAIFEAGAGRYEDYDCCCWQTLGTGQFRPLDGSTPFIGEKEMVETVDEYKVETVCKDEVLPEVLNALIAEHPYEEPAYSYFEINEEL
ncbi:MAG: NGG1p interacting factor NIF3 [Gammaproteobacteria bacterium]|nr:MAG: NGG1p interacting factor NIF3 [Gammaproteobacteria bacterium]